MQQREIDLAIMIGEEYGLSMVPTLSYMVHQAGEDNTQEAIHQTYCVFTRRFILGNW